MEAEDTYDRVLYCDRCGRKVRTVPIEWFSFEPVLCVSCRDEADRHALAV